MASSKTSIDEVLNWSHLALSDHQKHLLLSLERESMEAIHQTDAKDALPTLDPKEQAEVKAVLTRVFDRFEEKLRQLPSPDQPALRLVTGAPGSGKSRKVQQLLTPDALYLCGDEIKKAFFEEVHQSPLLSQNPKYLDAPYVHRITSDVNWSLLTLATQNSKNLVFEMLGSDPKPDAELMIDLIDQGYKVQVHHVAASTEAAISNAIGRYFDRNGDDFGRHISLTQIVNRQEQIVRSFIVLARMLGASGRECEFFLYDNSHWSMDLKHHWKSLGAIPELNLDIFLFSPPLKNKLWFKGDNRTADIVLFTGSGKELQIALIQRDKPPFEGFFALPGGFVRTSAQKGETFILGVETLAQAALRELQEETLISQDNWAQLKPVHLGTYTDRLRDPRNNEEAWVSSDAFGVQLDFPVPLHGSDDARWAGWKPVRALLSGDMEMAFDHKLIVLDALAQFHPDISFVETKNYGKKLIP